MIGGFLACWLFPPPTESPGRAAVDWSSLGQFPREGRRPAALGLAAFLIFAIVALTSPWATPGQRAGVTVLLTWAALGLAALGAILNSGPARARFLGAALFGVGYMALVTAKLDDLDDWPKHPTSRFLYSIRPRIPSTLVEHADDSDAIAAANRRVLKALDRAVPMPFPDETALEDVLRYVKASLRSAEEREVPIYVEPVGLQEAEKTIHSPVSIDLVDVPLKVALKLLFRELGLRYQVRDGLIVITSISSDSENDQPPTSVDPFLLTDPCLFALLAAGLGGLLAPLVAGQACRKEPPGLDGTGIGRKD